MLFVFTCNIAKFEIFMCMNSFSFFNFITLNNNNNNNSNVLSDCINYENVLVITMSMNFITVE
jgi:hypothetical protein